MAELTVVCTLFDGHGMADYSTGIFAPVWADKLYRGIERNTTAPFRFVCLTDHPEEDFAEDIETLGFEKYRHDKGCVLECLRVVGSPVLFMGLDTIITGDISHMANYGGKFAMLPDPYDARKMCSGVMMWREAGHIFDAFAGDERKSDFTIGRRLSDQVWLAQHTEPDNLENWFPGEIRSYKAHVKKHGLDGVSIVVFHGREKPHEIEDEELLRHWV